jgi:RHS repeat-associated protein
MARRQRAILSLSALLALLVTATTFASIPHHSRDARGAVTTQHLADGNTQTFDYHLSGSAKLFKDPKNEPTSITNDLLGRPTLINYVDGTTEKVTYEGARVTAVKDRQDRWQSFVYASGHLKEVWATPSGNMGDQSQQLDSIDYDAAGRVVALTNPDSRIDFMKLTFDGQPQQTKQTRYKNHRGLQNPTNDDVLDFYIQNHGYNSLGERNSYSIPPGAAAGYPGGATLKYDPMGNVTSIFFDDGVSLNSAFRGPGRPNTRDLSLPAASNSKILRRSYAYKDGAGDTGQLLEMKALIVDPVTSGSSVVAGTHVGYRGLQVSDAQLLGVSSGTRHSSYTYDDRGRLAGFVTAASGTAPPPGAGADPKAPGTASERPDAADFRASQVRVPSLDTATAAILTQHGVDVTQIDPPSMSATDLPGHKIGTVTSGTTTRTLDYGGKAELIDDGFFLYNYDAKGRLAWAMEKPGAAGLTYRRIRYDYDSRNRIVGRTAEAAVVASLPLTDANGLPWQTETRTDILASDGLPAETTFIWDPVADRLMSIVRANASFVPNDPNANIVKQFVHGEMGYDDPIQITTTDYTTPHNAGTPAPVKKLYPIYDEAAGGSLQVVLNEKGEIVARSITTDPFGGARFDLSGGAIDHVEITGSKDSGGTLQSVKVAMRSTEQLSAPTLDGGTRLAVVDSNGTVLRTAAAHPALDPTDPFTVAWTLTGPDWNALSDPAPVVVGGVALTPASLSIAATSTLRASEWAATTPFLPAPLWATASKPVYSSSATPIEVRESLTNVSSMITSLQPGETRTNVSYDIPNLSLTGSEAGDPNVAALFASSFQAQPFSEPFTHKIYVRNRWYDPTTGTFLSPDAMGYTDRSNLYAFAAGDPINGRDPTGLLCEKSNKSSGWWDLVTRCAQDTLSVAVEFTTSVQDVRNVGKNLKRAAGGVVSTAKLVGGVGQLFWDAGTMSVNDAAADRMVARGQAIGNFVAHPIDTTINAHTEMAENVLRHEQRGEYVASGGTAASQAQTDFLVAYSAYALGASAYRAVPGVTLEGNPMAVDRLAEAYDAMQGGNGSATPAPVAPTVGGLGAFPRAVDPIAEQIGRGHAFGKHVVKQGQFPGITTTDELASIAEDVMRNATNVRSLAKGRTAYYDA